MVSNDPIKDYMRRHACGFAQALDALAARLGPPTAHDIRRALQTLARAGAPVELLEALEDWSADQQTEIACASRIDRIDALFRPA
jgi:L-asparaginase II